ncbi:MAG TPA: DUF4397 domain-containing protein [Puia sp.]|nr:DUF4397 domain-containing protein [Puia sp.]
MKPRFLLYTISFSTLRQPKAKVLIPTLLAVFAFCCSKSSGVNENKANVTVAHVAPGFGPLDMLYGGSSILAGDSLSYGQSTGSPGNTYVEATAGVRNLEVQESGKPVLSGNTAFLQGGHYSVFAYDTLQNDSLKLLILQDNLQLYSDPLKDNVRFINFSPGSSLSLVMTNTTDTNVTVFQPFAGYQTDPSHYAFKPFTTGYYGVRVFRDSSFANSIPVDSVNLSTNTIYTLYLQGYLDSSGSKPLQLKVIQYN